MGVVGQCPAQVSELEEQLHAKAAECNELNAKMSEDTRRSHDEVQLKLHYKRIAQRRGVIDFSQVALAIFRPLWFSSN